MNSTIKVSVLADRKMRTLVQLANEEVAWLGSIKELKDENIILIDDIYIPKQQVNSTTCEIDEDAFEIIAMENDNPYIKLWGHSHVNMAVNPSSQDDMEINTLTKSIGDNQYIIRLILNKSGNSHMSVAINTQFGVIHQKVEYEIYDNEINTEIQSLLDVNVTKIVPIYKKYAPQYKSHTKTSNKAYVSQQPYSHNNYDDYDYNKEDYDPFHYSTKY